MGVMRALCTVPVMIAFVHNSFPGVLRGTTLGIRSALTLSFCMLSARKMSRHLAVRECVPRTASTGMGMSHTGDTPTAKAKSWTVMPTRETAFQGTSFSQATDSKSTAEMKCTTGMFLASRLQCASTCFLRQIEKNHRFDVWH